MPLASVLASVLSLAVASAFNLSNTLGSNMVLQRAPGSAVVFGFAAPTEVVTTSFRGRILRTVTGDDGVWRQRLPPQNASFEPTDIHLSSSTGGKADLLNVVFGDVIFCSGQSNMQYTPRTFIKKKGCVMNNMSSEIDAADCYNSSIWLFTVAPATVPARGQPPLPEQTQLQTAPELSWQPASSKSLGGAPFSTFSAVCWLYGRRLQDELKVPIGLVSAAVGGTALQSWSPRSALQQCGNASHGGPLGNAMIHPFGVGPMGFRSFIWYQAEANAEDPTNQADYYRCLFPASIRAWRGWLGNPLLPLADVRQAQLSALQLDSTFMSTAIDSGDWYSQHPSDKQTPAKYLADQALVQIYGRNLSGTHFPLFAGQKVETTHEGDAATSTIKVTVSLLAGGKPVQLTTEPPLAATQSSMLGCANNGTPSGNNYTWGSVPRNRCVTDAFPPTDLRFPAPHSGNKCETRQRCAVPASCGYPAIIGIDGASLNATAKIGPAGSNIVLTAVAPSGFVVAATSYGRADWPMTLFFTKHRGLPVIPWYAALNATNPCVNYEYHSSDYE